MIIHTPVIIVHLPKCWGLDRQVKDKIMMAISGASHPRMLVLEVDCYPGMGSYNCFISNSSARISLKKAHYKDVSPDKLRPSNV